MSDDSKVVITLKDGALRPLNSNVLYKQDGGKERLDPKFVKWGAIGGFILISIYMMFKEPAVDFGRPNIQSSIEEPGAISQDSSIQVPLASSEQSRANRGVRAAPINFSGSQLVSRPHMDKIPPGAIGKAILITGASNGPVRAKLTESLNFAGETYAEEGAILVGTGSSAEERLVVRFDKLVGKDGALQDINSEACDPSDGTPGLKGSKVGGYALQLAGSIGLNFAAGMSEGMQDTEVKGGVAYKETSVKNALLKGTAQAALDQSREMMSSLKNRAPIIQVPKESQIIVLFQ